MICALEKELHYGDNAKYRMVAGGALAMMYARSRCDDAQNAIAMKTATSVAKRRRLMPMVVPNRGMLGQAWAAARMDLRDKMNLSLAEGYPVLPDLGPDGPLKSAMPSQRVGA